MDRNESIKAISRAGKAGELVELFTSLADEAQSRYDYVRSDRTRTDAWRQWRVANDAQGYIARLDKELEKLARSVGQVDRSDAESVFGVSGIRGDEASKTISRRDAGDRVAGINQPSELKDLLIKATRQNDEILARAIAERALEIGDNQTLERFMDDRPDKASAVERLWNAERSGVDMLMMTARMSAILPTEARTFSAVDSAARGEEPGAPERSRGVQEGERRREAFAGPLNLDGPGW